MTNAMTMPWTLQRYILREMAKTFGLTAVALTGLLTCGGGVMQMIKLGDVSPDQLLTLLALIVPVSLALTLPIAALFSATATYGRLSADNEFVACRSSGINLHILFLPTVVLSLLSATVTFVLINFVIPGMVQNINQFIEGDVGAMVQRRLNRPSGIRLGRRFRIHADNSTVDAADPDRIVLQHVAFVQLDKDDWVRYGTAREVFLDFERSPQRIKVSGWMSGLSYYDRKQGQFVEQAEQVIPTNIIPSLLPQKLKFLTLPELLHYHARPQEWYHVRDGMERLRREVGRLRVYQALWDDWRDGSDVVIADSRTTITLRSELAVPPDERGIELTGGVTIEERRDGTLYRYTAERVLIDLTPGDTMGDATIRVEAYAVTEHEGDREYTRPKRTLRGVAVEPALVAQVEALTNEELLRPDSDPSDSKQLANKRHKARELIEETVREVRSTISERFAFSVSVFVLMILGAALGIVFRGAHVVTAFGISFVPSLFVIIAIVMGKQMSHNAPTHILGLGVMWSGIVGVAGLDVWTLLKVLRR